MNKKLIIVDDEKNIRETIKDYFEDSGWSVNIFSTGEDALKFLEKETAGYIIVDGRLPGMSGTDFIRRSITIRSGIKYIIYTGSFDFPLDDDLRAAGVTEKSIVMKPAMGFKSLHDALENK